jgi:hypothetical protein
MSFKAQLLSILAALLLTAPLALAAPTAPEATPQTPAVAAAQPPAALSPAGPAACKGGDLPIFSPAPQDTANDTCGACSDAACAGQPVHAVCGVGFRCIVTGPSCSTVSLYRCRCSII